MYDKDVTYAADQLKSLVGYQIVDTVITSDGESYGFVVQKDPHGEPVEKKVCWVDCDPEGNGPGWLQIEELKDEPKATGG
jgi:NADPH-dependent glutamate synthase beta subunit-like oxidoreductase